MKRIISVLFILGIIAGTIGGLVVYKAFFMPNTALGKEKAYFYVPSGANYEEVKNLLSDSILIDPVSFDLLANKMNYPAHVRAGKYEIKNGMSNRALILLLRSGKQVPVKVIFNKVRSIDELAEIVAEDLEFKPEELTTLLQDLSKIEGLDAFNKDNILALFLPNTYEFYWNSSALDFVKRMQKEYAKYWNAERSKLAKAQKMTSQEVIALASIVEEESNRADERPIIAGLYLNRLKRNMLLQADPTVRFAMGNFEIRRVLTKHLQTDSPYNTYLYKGVPPGPICTPSLNSIEAVLRPTTHNYLYMCAKADFSGKHAFATTHSEHMRNARAFQKALNDKKIYQ